jgi:hypothetical protein
MQPGKPKHGSVLRYSVGIVGRSEGEAGMRLRHGVVGVSLSWESSAAASGVEVSAMLTCAGLPRWADGWNRKVRSGFFDYCGIDVNR